MERFPLLERGRGQTGTRWDGQWCIEDKYRAGVCSITTATRTLSNAFSLAAFSARSRFRWAARWRGFTGDGEGWNVPMWVSQMCVGGLFSVLIGAIAYVLKRTIGRLDEHGAKLVAMELDLARNYVKHADLNALRDELAGVTKMLGDLLIRTAVIATKLGIIDVERGGK